MNDPVDILVATYNGARYLRPQLDSLRRQSHTTLRVLMRDDHSSDATPSILEEYVQQDHRFHVIPSGEQLGAKGNFSRLLAHAEANYIMFCDQDDLWRPEKVALTLTKMKEMEKRYGKRLPLLVHTDLKVVNEELKVLSHSFWKYSCINPYHLNTLNKLLAQSAVTGCAMMINRPLAQLAVPIPEEAVMHDWWVSLIAAAFGKIGVEDHATLLYRQHNENNIGATRHHSLEGLRQGFRRLLAGSSRGRRQAQAFYNRFKDDFDERTLRLVKAYLSLPSHSYFVSRLLVVRYGFWKSGLLRNLALFLNKNNP